MCISCSAHCDGVVLLTTDHDLQTEIVAILRKGGLEPIATEYPARAHAALQDLNAPLAIVDLHAIWSDGLALVRELAGQGIPVVTLTGEDGELERIISLEAGAVDSLSRPFNPRELLARVRALVRRTPRASSPQPREDGLTRFFGWSFDRRSGQLRTPAGQRVLLTRTDLALLSVLAERLDQLVTPDDMVVALGPSLPVRTAVCRLRRRLAAKGAPAEMIRTVYAQGYVLSASPESAAMVESLPPPPLRKVA